MFKTDNKFPIPVLRPSRENNDYTQGVFKDEIKSETDENGYHLETNFSVTNKYIDQLIRDGVLQYGIQVECLKTHYRRFFPISPEKTTVHLSQNDVHNTVYLQAFIIVRERIENFSSKQFKPGFRDIKFSLSPGDFVGIGEKRRFYAYFKDELIPDEKSIAEIVRDSDVEEPFTELSEDYLRIHLPDEQYDQYCALKGSQELYPILNLMVTQPALIEAIMEISKEYDENQSESDFSDCKWYKTLKTNLEKTASKRKKKIEDLFEYPMQTANMLLKNKMSEALEYLVKI